MEAARRGEICSANIGGTKLDGTGLGMVVGGTWDGTELARAGGTRKGAPACMCRGVWGIGRR